MSKDVGYGGAVGVMAHSGPEFKKRFKNLHNPLIKFLTFLSRKSQKEWSVEEFYIVNFSKTTKNQQKSNERVVIP